MHNTLTRLQNTFSQITSIAFFLALVISALSLIPLDQYYHSYRSSSSSASVDLSSPPHQQAPTATLNLRNIQVVRGRPHYYSTKREEYAVVRFDLDADLSPLFGWNTKQVFVYVGIEYPSTEDGNAGYDQNTHTTSLSSPNKSKGTNKAVIWDIIIPAPTSKWTFTGIKRRWLPASKKKQNRKRSSSATSTKQSSSTSTTAKPGLLSLKNQKPKYQITDPSGIISSRPNATLTLNWNIQPWVGPLLWDQGTLDSKNGISGSAPLSEAAAVSLSFLSSWNLPFLRYQWQGQRLPRSEVFDFPPLKGAKKVGDAQQKDGDRQKQQQQQEVVKDEDGPKTPRAAGVAGIVG